VPSFFAPSAGCFLANTGSLGKTYKPSSRRNSKERGEIVRRTATGGRF